MYVSGFGGNWSSYTLGGTLGLAWQATEAVRFGGGVFKSRYKENDLDFDGEYDLESLGASAWLDHQPAPSGFRANAVAMYADMNNDIDRGYMNGAGLDKSKGSPDGDMYGALVRLGWVLDANEKTDLTPFSDYTWTHVEIDAYTEKGGAFPAYFGEREDDAHTLRIGLEVETEVSGTFDAWGQVAYGKRLDDDSNGISGDIIGLMSFSAPGYSLDDDWVEADIGGRWRVGSETSIVATVYAAANNDQQPDWRASLGLTWDL